MYKWKRLYIRCQRERKKTRKGNLIPWLEDSRWPKQTMISRRPATTQGYYVCVQIPSGTRVSSLFPLSRKLISIVLKTLTWYGLNVKGNLKKIITRSRPELKVFLEAIFASGDQLSTCSMASIFRQHLS